VTPPRLQLGAYASLDSQQVSVHRNFDCRWFCIQHWVQVSWNDQRSLQVAVHAPRMCQRSIVIDVRCHRMTFEWPSDGRSSTTATNVAHLSRMFPPCICIASLYKFRARIGSQAAHWTINRSWVVAIRASWLNYTAAPIYRPLWPSVNSSPSTFRLDCREDWKRNVDSPAAGRASALGLIRYVAKPWRIVCLLPAGHSETTMRMQIVITEAGSGRWHGVTWHVYYALDCVSRAPTQWFVAHHYRRTCIEATCSLLI